MDINKLENGIYAQIHTAKGDREIYSYALLMRKPLLQWPTL